MLSADGGDRNVLDGDPRPGAQDRAPDRREVLEDPLLGMYGQTRALGDELREAGRVDVVRVPVRDEDGVQPVQIGPAVGVLPCLLYTSDAADD